MHFYKTATLLAIAGLCLNANAQGLNPGTVSETKADTIIDVAHPRSVEISDNGRTMSVKVCDKGHVESHSFLHDSEPAEKPWDLDLPFLRSPKRSKWTITFFDRAYIGFLMPVQADYGMRHSFEVGIDNIVGLEYHPSRSTTMSIGVGIGYSRMNIGRGMMATKVDGALVLAPSAGTDCRSHYQWVTSSIPVMLRQNIVDDLDIEIGAIAQFSTVATASSRWRVGDLSYSASYRNLQPSPFSVSLQSTIYYDGLGLYFKWSPMRQMRKGWGPDFSTVSTGIIITF